jgi:hypothetical protein
MSAPGEATGEPRPEGGGGARLRGGRLAGGCMLIRTNEAEA